MVFDAFPDLPHLPELPARGPGAGMVGRSAALLVDLHVDLQHERWRLTSRPGVDERRARATLAGDLDALEEVASGWTGPLKVQVSGPWTLATAIELPRGGPALADPGACRDLTASLAEGVAAHLVDLRRRVPGARLVVQVDEPSLPAVLAGSVPTASGFGWLPPVEPHVALQALQTVLAASGVFPVVHCCAGAVPVAVLRDAGARAVSLDIARLRPADHDALAEVVDGGMSLFTGMTFAASDGRPSPDRATVQQVRVLARRLGIRPDDVSSTVVVTPSCGLAEARARHARDVMARAREVARELADDPEG